MFFILHLPAFQRKTNVLAHNNSHVLTSREISVRIPLLLSRGYSIEIMRLRTKIDSVSVNPNTASLLKYLITHIPSIRDVDVKTGASAKVLRLQKSIEGILYRSERWSRTMESLRTPKIEQHHSFVPSVSFLVKSPYVIISIST